MTGARASSYRPGPETSSRTPWRSFARGYATFPPEAPSCRPSSPRSCTVHKTHVTSVQLPVRIRK